MVSTAPSPEEVVIQGQMLRAFQDHARQLGKSAQQVLFMRLHGMSFREIALAMDKTETWARVTYFRAKSKILSEMEEWR